MKKPGRPEGVHAKPIKERSFRKEAFDWLERHKVPCHKCGELVVVDIEPDTKVPKMICEGCKNRLDDGPITSWKTNGRKISTLATIHGSQMECKIYRPGDRGFKTRAKQCTPILDIAS